MFSIQPFDREGRMHQNQCIKSILGSLIQQGEPESQHSEGRSVRAVSVILPHWVWRKACMNMWTILPWIHCWDSSMITVAFMCTAVVRNSEFKTKARFLNYTNTFKFHNELNAWCWKVWKHSLNAKLRLSFLCNSTSFLSWKRRLFKMVPPQETRAFQETEHTWLLLQQQSYVRVAVRSTN